MPDDIKIFVLPESTGALHSNLVNIEHPAISNVASMKKHDVSTGVIKETNLPQVTEPAFCTKTLLQHQTASNVSKLGGSCSRLDLDLGSSSGSLLPYEVNTATQIKEVPDLLSIEQDNYHEETMSSAACLLAIDLCDDTLNQTALRSWASPKDLGIQDWKYTSDLGPDSETPLSLAVMTNNISACEKLLQADSTMKMTRRGESLCSLPNHRHDELDGAHQLQVEHQNLRECCFRTPLQVAVWRNKLEMLEIFLRFRSGSCTSGVYPPLFLSIWRRHTQALKVLLKHNLNLDEYFYCHLGHLNALQAACYFGDMEAVPLLVDAGAKVNAYREDTGARTALQYATERCFARVAIYLLENGADPNLPSTGDHGLSPLHSATLARQGDLIQNLLHYRADVKQLSSALGERAALSMAIRASSVPLFCRLVETLPEKSAAIFSPAQDSLLFQRAFRIGGRKLAECLLKHTSPPDLSAYPDRHKALQAAVEEGNIMLAALLIIHGVEIDTMGTSKPERTLLQAAFEKGHRLMVQFLIEYGADVNAPPSPCSGLTALQAACQGQHIDLVDDLIQSGVDVNAPACREGGVTALQAAATNGCYEIAVNLLRAGADVAAQGSLDGGYTALNAAAVGGHLNVVALLLAKHWKRQTHSLLTTIAEATVYARWNGHQSVVNFLEEELDHISRRDLNHADSLPRLLA